MFICWLRAHIVLAPPGLANNIFKLFCFLDRRLDGSLDVTQSALWPAPPMCSVTASPPDATHSVVFSLMFSFFFKKKISMTRTMSGHFGHAL
jgi:hypothetical protein